VVHRPTPPEDLLTHSVTIRADDTIELERLIRDLITLGYESDTPVARPGQFSRRGGILDIYPSTAESPIRIELFGDEIESLRSFDVSTQRSTAALSQVTLCPAREVLLTTERANLAVQRITAAAY